MTAPRNGDVRSLHPVGGFYRGYGKRLFDLAMTIPAMIILAPLMAATAVAVRLKLGSPVLFCQMRPGMNGTPFNIYKFRTMIDARDHDGRVLPDAERLTPFGKFLRASSIDELPELWNIIRGDMSLVGPRPLLLQYLPLYSAEQFRRHEVRPGLTGLAQVMGRNALTWDQKFEADIKYVDTYSFRLDAAIILRTVLKIITRSGISAPGDATMPVFKGSPNHSPDDKNQGADDK